MHSTVEHTSLAPSSSAPHVRPRRTRARSGRRWFATFVAFPPSGLAAIAVVDRVDAPAAALVGGLVAGAGIGAAQAWALLPRFGSRRTAPAWAAVTAAAMSIGLTVGAAAVDYRTSLGALATMGAITGTAVGIAQGGLLWRGTSTTRRHAGVWVALQPLLWSLGWVVTTLAGVDVERQYAVFGATGALITAALGALFHHRVGADRQLTPREESRR